MATFSTFQGENVPLASFSVPSVSLLQQRKKNSLPSWLSQSLYVNDAPLKLNLDSIWYPLCLSSGIVASCLLADLLLLQHGMANSLAR